MSVDRVSIKVLHDLVPSQNPEDPSFVNDFAEMTPHEQARIFKGSDLYLNTQTGDLEYMSGETKRTRLIKEDQHWILNLKSCDVHNEDPANPEIETGEMAKCLEEHGQYADPAAFMEFVDRVVKVRYTPIAKNLEKWRAENSADNAFTVQLDLLHDDNHSLYEEEVRQAHQTFPDNALHKSALNIVSWGGYNLFYRPIAYFTGLPRTESWNPWDEVAVENAAARFEERKAAIQELELEIQKGIRAGETWALEGNLSEALQRVETSTRELLDGELDASGHYNRMVLAKTDEKAAANQWMEYVKRERPTNFGSFAWGGGNTSGVHLFNYTGTRNKFSLAQSILYALMTKKATDDVEFNQQLRAQAKVIREEIKGDEFAGLWNLAVCSVSDLPCRPWSDVKKVNSFGSSIETGLYFYGGFKFLGWTSSFFGLRRLLGIKQAAKIWNVEAKGLKIFPAKTLEFRRQELLIADAYPSRLKVLGIKDSADALSFLRLSPRQLKRQAKSQYEEIIKNSELSEELHKVAKSKVGFPKQPVHPKQHANPERFRQEMELYHKRMEAYHKKAEVFELEAHQLASSPEFRQKFAYGWLKNNQKQLIKHLAELEWDWIHVKNADKLGWLGRKIAKWNKASPGEKMKSLWIGAKTANQKMKAFVDATIVLGLYEYATAPKEENMEPEAAADFSEFIADYAASSYEDLSLFSLDREMKLDPW